MNKAQLKVGVQYAVHEHDSRFVRHRVGEVHCARYLGEIPSSRPGRYLGGGRYAEVTDLEFEIVKPGDGYRRRQAGDKIRLTKAGNVWATWEGFKVDLKQADHDKAVRARLQERTDGAVQALGLGSWTRSWGGGTRDIVVSAEKVILAAVKWAGYEPPSEIEPLEEP